MRKNCIMVAGKEVSAEKFGEMVETASRRRKISQTELGQELAKGTNEEIPEPSGRVIISRIEQGVWRPVKYRWEALIEILELNGTNDNSVTTDAYTTAMSELLKTCAGMKANQLELVVTFAKQIKENT